MDSLPTFSFDELSRREITHAKAKSLVAVLEKEGFFYLNELPISNDTFDKLLALSDAFFSLPLDEKLTISIEKSRAYRGYSVLGAEKTNQKTDWKESLDFGLDTNENNKPLHGMNQWPEEPLDFKQAFQDYYRDMMRIGNQLMRCIAQGYALPEQYFESLFVGVPFCIMRILAYPASEGKRQGIGAHADYGCLNMLYQDEQGGLEIQSARGQWQSVEPRPYTLLVNAGDMLSYWSGGRIRSLTHRVYYQGKKRRLSIPFFYEPGFDTLIKPFDDETKPSLHYGQHLLKAYERSFAMT